MNLELGGKDKRIQNVVKYLLNKFEKEGIKIQDYWEADKCAIGLIDSSHKFLLYISTFGLKENKFNVALENPPKEDSDLPYEPVGAFENIDLDKLEELLLKHLIIKNYNNQQEL